MITITPSALYCRQAQTFQYLMFFYFFFFLIFFICHFRFTITLNILFKIIYFQVLNANAFHFETGFVGDMSVIVD